jgi:hypothetical protein
MGFNSRPVRPSSHHHVNTHPNPTHDTMSTSRVKKTSRAGRGLRPLSAMTRQEIAAEKQAESIADDVSTESSH